jgi:hypothetical protein
LLNGKDEVTRYVEAAKIHCPVRPGSFPPVWSKGTNYPAKYLISGNPNLYLEAKLMSPGVIGYRYVPTNNNPAPAPVPIPSSAFEKLKRLVEKLNENMSRVKETIAEYMKDNPDLVTYLKGAAIGAAAAIVVGTIVEDFLTAGAGILDDWGHFWLAYKIVRYAWTL